MSKAQKGNKENKKPKADKNQSNSLLKKPVAAKPFRPLLLGSRSG